MSNPHSTDHNYWDEIAQDTHINVKTEPKFAQVGMSAEEKVRQQNRIRQFAYKVREKMPKDYESYCLVAAHLIKNAHRYYNVESDVKSQVGVKMEQDSNDVDSECKTVNKKLREIRTLKRQNRIIEQQEFVSELKSSTGSYRNISKTAGIALKTVHEWCSVPKERIHKASSRAQLRKEEFTNFLMQDTITYSHPCQRYAGKKFLMHTWDEIYKRYVQQAEFHKHGFLAKSTVRGYKPKNILLSGSTPVNQCLCDICENCQLIKRALLAVGLKGIPPNKYLMMESTYCDIKHGQFGTSYQFCPHTCITRNCDSCGIWKLRQSIHTLNAELLQLNRPITWHRWQVFEGKTAPRKGQIKGTLRSAVNEFLEIVEDMSGHVFRSNWNRNIFQYIRGHLEVGYVLQVIDFAMNFNNRYQDVLQSAYYGGSQTTIHATINFFRCLREGCNENVTLALVHISNDMKHDSFLARAAQNLTFRYLVEVGVPLHLILQFCDNCAAQYKSRRPFAEIARCALEIIRVYFGEKHGKSHADALFGRLKSWMAYKIKARHFVVADAYDFFKYCREFYQTPRLENTCQHYRVEFEFIHPSAVRRHQDCDLDKPVENTHSIYSVRNTPEPLSLKVRNVPCLCPPCIKNNGEECLNSLFADPWRDVKLIPTKGANKRKYQKRKRPDADLQQSSIPVIAAENKEESEESEIDDDELPDIVFVQQEKTTKKKKSNLRKKSVTDHVTDRVTDRVTDHVAHDVAASKKAGAGKPSEKCTWVNEEIQQEEIEIEEIIFPNDEVEIIDLCSRASREIDMAQENASGRVTDLDLNGLLDLLSSDIPESVIWESISSALYSCTTDTMLEEMAQEVEIRLPVLASRKESHYSPEKDQIDSVAQGEIPIDGPCSLKAIQTYGDGNCLPRALSRVYFGDDSRYLEVRVRIAIEGILNRKFYLSDSCLERGASYLHSNADLPTVFATFSDYYTPGQKIGQEMISYIYSKEVHECCRSGTYMGLWQLAQASTVFGVPLHTIYPHRGGSTIRNDFHRIFFPVMYPPVNDDEPIVIMWTGRRKGAVPNHFVPLVKKPE